MKTIKLILIILFALIGLNNNINAQSFEVPTGPFLDSTNYVPPRLSLHKTNGTIIITDYKQCGQAWSNNNLGACTNTVCQSGCAMTAAAILLKANGVNVDPGQLNTWLTNNCGYVDNSGTIICSDCNIRWNIVPNYHGTNGATLTWGGSYTGTLAQYLSTLKSQIDAGNPSIVHVDRPYGSASTTLCNHFIVVYGYNNSGTSASDFLVSDPGTTTYPTGGCKLSNYTICSNYPGALRLYNNVTSGGGTTTYLPAPVLTSPPNAGGNQLITPTFSWSAVIGASSYRIMVATNSSALPNDPTASDFVGTGGIINATTTGTGTSYIPTTNMNYSTTYYWEVHARSTDYYGTWSSVWSFTTSSPTVTPTITTATATSITSTTASSGGNVTADGGATVTARGVCWSTGSNPTTVNIHTSDGTGTGSFTSSMTGLSSGTLYHYRAYATNSVGTSYGSDLTFTTSVPVVAPTITTTTATNINITTASSGGNITSDGGAAVTARGVCWSSSSNPTVGNSHTSDGTGTGSFTSGITGLSSGTLYHYRAYSTNSAGTSYGSELTFTTQPTTPLAPTVTTTTATSITSTTASSGGNISSDGGATVTARGVCWSSSSNPTLGNSHTSDGTGTGSFTSSITGLSPGTLYHYRAYATNSAGTSYGSELTFTTSVPVVAPTVTTTTTTNINIATASSGGNVTSDGGASVTARGVCWSISSNPTTANSRTLDGTGTGIFTSSITGLSPGTLYHYRAYATNSAGTSYGSDLTFTTLVNVVTPTVTTTTAINITITTASSGGNVTSDGGATVTARGVCWSTSSNPTTANSYTSDGTGTGIFTSSITGLSLGTLYHYRAYATNSAGTSYGSDLTFTTLVNVVTPTVTTTTTTNITSTTASSGGNVTSDGGATVTARGVCWSISSNPTTANSHTSDGTGTGSFTSSITGLSSGTLYHYRAYATNSAGTSYGSDLTFTATFSTPTITVSTSSLDFGNVVVGQNSSPQTYTLSGSNLTANITITAPSGFQISTSSNSGFGISLPLTQSGGTVQSKTIYVRFSPISTGFQSGTILHTSTDATTKDISVSGTGTAVSTPTIRTFFPISGPLDTAVTIIGTNFSTTTENNIVYFGAVRAQVTSATQTQLVVTVPPGATYQPISVTVNGLTAYANAPFIVTFPSSKIINSSSFASKLDFTTGTNPENVAICDVDGDGKPDLIITNYGGNTVSVFRNTSDSGSITANSFASRVDFATGSVTTGEYGVAIGDVDGDGKPDIVVTNFASNNVSVFRNVSIPGSITSSSFASSVEFTTGARPYSVSMADIDGDGKPDLVVANHSSNSVSVFKNTSTSGSVTVSSFASKVDFATGTNPQCVVIGDVDGDDKPDLVVTNWSSNTVSVFRNTSNSNSITVSSFAPKVDFTTGSSPISVAVSDVDGDGKPDLVVTNAGGTVSIFRNISDSGSITASSFASKVDFTTGKYPYSIAIVDIDGDGKPDLVVPNYNGNTVSVFRNISNSGSIAASSFASKVDFTTGSYPDAVALGDIDGDGKPDIVVTNGADFTVSVFRNIIPRSSPVGVEHTQTKISTVFSLTQNYPNPFNPSTMISYDLPKEGMVSIKIYDMLGREVKNLVNEYKSVGSYTVEFNASNLTSGIYFYRLTTENFTQIKKLVLMK